MSLTVEEHLRKEYEEARIDLGQKLEGVKESRTRVEELERLWRAEQRRNMEDAARAQKARG